MRVLVVTPEEEEEAQEQREGDYHAGCPEHVYRGFEWFRKVQGGGKKSDAFLFFF